MAPSSEPTVPHLHLDLPSIFDSVERVVEETQAFTDAEIDDEELGYRVVLLASEAVTNAIEHGNAGDPARRVRFDVLVFPDRVEIVVEDEGSGFDPQAVDNPLKKDNLLQDSGRGIFLMEEMADAVQWEADGCRVRLTINRAS